MTVDVTTDVCVEIADLHFRYGTRDFALHLPALSVRRGECVVIVGPSGSGKTTLLNLIAGILSPDTGSIRVNGEDLATRSDRQRRRYRIRHIGLIFQEFELLEHLTVRENILLPFHVNRSLPLTEANRTFMAELASSLGIGARLDRRPRALSQGERQRVAIARALVTQPDIVLADEPTGNLDPDNTRHILDLLLSQAARQNATLFMVTHDHSLLDAFDRVIDFNDIMVNA